MEKYFLHQTFITHQSWISSRLDKMLLGSMTVVFPLFIYLFIWVISRCNSVYLQRVKITCSWEEKYLRFHFRRGDKDESLQSCTFCTGHMFWKLLFHCPCSPGGSEIRQVHRIFKKNTFEYNHSLVVLGTKNTIFWCLLAFSLLLSMS